MKKTLISAYILVFVAALTLAAVSAQAEITNGDDDSTASAPSAATNTGNSTGSITNGDDDSTAGAPATATNSGNSNPSNTNGDDDVPNGNGGSNNPEDNGNPDSGSPRSSSRRTSSGNSLNGAVAGTATTSCPLITDYLKLGGSNNPVQVTKLQIFLRDAEKLDVAVTGTFDQKTEDAVKAFQKKYLASVLGPWEATRATGFVYITTTKKINELACAQPLTLTAEELAIINEFKSRGQSDSVMTDETGIGNATGTLEVGNISGEDNTAAAGGASILSRFWAFLKSLFR